MNCLHFFCISLISMHALLCTAQTSNLQNGTVVFPVGVILDLDSIVGQVGLSCLSMALSDFYTIHNNYTTKIVLHIADSKGQVIDAAASALSLIKNTRVNAIIGPQKSSEAIVVSDLGDRAHIPIISFSATSPSLPPRTPYFVQAAQSDATQAGAISSIVKAFPWTEVVIIYENSEYGNGIVPYLTNSFQDTDARVTYQSVIPLSATDDFLSNELYKMMTMRTRVYIVHLSHSLSTRFFLKVKELDMMGEGYAWMVTSGLMDQLYTTDSNVVEAMQGVLGVKPQIPNSEKLDSFALRWKRSFLQDDPTIKQAEISSMGLWAYDTLWALALAAEKVGSQEPSAVASTIATKSTIFFGHEVIEKGSELLTALLQTRFQGLSGEFRLVNGELQPSSFQIMNVVGKGEREVGICPPLYGVSRGPSMSVAKSNSTPMENLQGIIWPGESTTVPRGWDIPRNGLRIGVPVISVAEFVRVDRDPRTNIPSFSGYCIDVFDSVVKELPYALNYEYVAFERPGDSYTGYYDDLIYQVSQQKFDAAVGDIIITANRSQYVDFTLPYDEGGVSMIVPINYNEKNSVWAFLKPLKGELWLVTIILFILTGCSVWILEHRRNGEFRGPPHQQAGMIFWLPFASLVFAHRETIMNNFARFVLVVWMFVVLVLTSSYTASLSSRLTVERLQPTETNVEQLIQKGDHVGHEEGSFVSEYLKGMGFKECNLKSYKRAKHIDEALSNGSISAFFDAAPHTKLFLSRYCQKYMVVGPVYPSNGVAFAFQRGSPLVADLNRAIVKATEGGKISKIEEMWFANRMCTSPESTISSNRMSLKNFEVLFIITGGVTRLCAVIYLGIFLYRHRDLIRTSRNSGTTWCSTIRKIFKEFDRKEATTHPTGENRGSTDNQRIDPPDTINSSSQPTDTPGLATTSVLSEIEEQHPDPIHSSSQPTDTPGLATTSVLSEIEEQNDANGSSHQNKEDIEANISEVVTDSRRH